MTDEHRRSREIIFSRIEAHPGISNQELSAILGWTINRVTPRTRATVAESALDIEGMSERQAKDTLKKMLAEYPSDVIHEDKPARSADHPTMKPVALMARQIFNSTHAGDIVLDPFGGSGSTLAACEQIHRRCAIMELDPVYCDVIIKRWENLTGRTAERLKP